MKLTAVALTLTLTLTLTPPCEDERNDGDLVHAVSLSMDAE